MGRKVYKRKAKVEKAATQKPVNNPVIIEEKIEVKMEEEEEEQKKDELEVFENKDDLFSESSSSEDDSDDEEFIIDNKELFKEDPVDFVEDLAPAKKIPKKNNSKKVEFVPEKEEEMDVKEEKPEEEDVKNVITDEKDNIFKRPRKRLQKRPGDPKRRRIKRPIIIVEDKYRCGTFMNFSRDLGVQVRDIEPDDDLDMENFDYVMKKMTPPINFDENAVMNDALTKFLEKKFKPAEPAEPVAEDEEKIEKEKNDKKETTSINFFAEKIAGYTGYRSIHGFCKPTIQTYHPDMLQNQSLYNIPFIYWRRPFKFMIHQKSIDDPFRNVKKMIETQIQGKRENFKREILSSVLSRAKEYQGIHQSIVQKSEISVQNHFLLSDEFEIATKSEDFIEIKVEEPMF